MKSVHLGDGRVAVNANSERASERPESWATYPERRLATSFALRSSPQGRVAIAPVIGNVHS